MGDYNSNYSILAAMKDLNIGFQENANLSPKDSKNRPKLLR
jgi:hypothetical protein